MEIRFQPALLQEVIDSFIEKTEREGDPTYYKEFHELADPIYEKFSLDDREPEFKKLYQYLFGIWGFSDIVRDAFNEFPSLKDRIGIVLVKGVLKEDQEGVDILRKWGSVERELAKEFEEKGLKGVGRLRKAELVTKLAEAMPVHSPLVSRPDHAPTGPDAQVGGHGEPSAWATRSARAPAMADQAGSSDAAQSVNEVQQAAMDAKFFLGPEDQSPPTPAPELAATYNDNRLMLLARDPYWLYAYWDFSVEQIGAALTRLGVQDARPILRVFDVTYVHFDGTNAWSAVDIELTPFATNWYIPVPQPDAAYCVEVGYRTPDGRFAAYVDPGRLTAFVSQLPAGYARALRDPSAENSVEVAARPRPKSVTFTSPSTA